MLKVLIAICAFLPHLAIGDCSSLLQNSPRIHSLATEVTQKHLEATLKVSALLTTLAGKEQSPAGVHDAVTLDRVVEYIQETLAPPPVSQLIEVCKKQADSFTTLRQIFLDHSVHLLDPETPEISKARTQIPKTFGRKQFQIIRERFTKTEQKPEPSSTSEAPDPNTVVVSQRDIFSINSFAKKKVWKALQLMGVKQSDETYESEFDSFNVLFRIDRKTGEEIKYIDVKHILKKRRVSSNRKKHRVRESPRNTMITRLKVLQILRELKLPSAVFYAHYSGKVKTPGEHVVVTD